MTISQGVEREAPLWHAYSMTSDIVVQDREELILLLCEVAEFEHAVIERWRAS